MALGIQRSKLAAWGRRWGPQQQQHLLAEAVACPNLVELAEAPVGLQGSAHAFLIGSIAFQDLLEGSNEIPMHASTRTLCPC